jgi:hypothetical protein
LISNATDASQAADATLTATIAACPVDAPLEGSALRLGRCASATEHLVNGE